MAKVIPFPTIKVQVNDDEVLDFEKYERFNNPMRAILSHGMMPDTFAAMITAVMQGQIDAGNDDMRDLYGDLSVSSAVTAMLYIVNDITGPAFIDTAYAVAVVGVNAPPEERVNDYDTLLISVCTDTFTLNCKVMFFDGEIDNSHVVDIHCNEMQPTVDDYKLSPEDRDVVTRFCKEADRCNGGVMMGYNEDTESTSLTYTYSYLTSCVVAVTLSIKH